MRAFWLVMTVLVAAPAIEAQAVGPEPEDPGTDEKFAFTGSVSAWLKVNNPSAGGDWFNVDFDTTAQSCTVVGVAIEIWNSTGTAETMPSLGLYPESTVFSNSPDTANPIATVAATVASTDGFTDIVYYPLPCTELGSTDVHLAGNWRSGDQSTWVGVDTVGAASNRSFLTSSAYASGASPLGGNWVAGLEIVPAAATAGTLLINGSKNAVLNVFETMCITAWLAEEGLGFVLYYCPGGVPFLPLLPVAFTISGQPLFPAACANGWQACLPVECSFVAGIPIDFCMIYQDPLNPRPTGKPSLALSDKTSLFVVDQFGQCTSGCFGIRDDGFHEGFAWKLTNPSGPSDWFDVNFGAASSTTAAGAGGASIVAVEMGISESCGTPGAWLQVGQHPANLTLDPSGNTPDTGSGGFLVGPAVAPNTTHSATYPGTVYDTPDVPINTTDIYHAAVGWQSGDTCLWIASDTDGTDANSGCGQPIPGTSSRYSQNGYLTPSSPGSAANWAMKLNWQ